MALLLSRNLFSRSFVAYSEINPAIDPTAFPSTPLSIYWTATALAVTPNAYYLVEFGQGLVLSASASATVVRRVRCVR